MFEFYVVRVYFVSNKLVNFTVKKCLHQNQCERSMRQENLKELKSGF